MSTKYTYQDGEVCIFWKGNCVSRFPAQAGDKIRIHCWGGAPEATVMIAPANPLIRTFWNYGFYKNQRVNTLEDLRQIVKQTTRYSGPHGYEIPAASLYISDNCAISYRAAMEGWIGRPYGWWATADATPEEALAIISKALGQSALHLYT
ncbi:hypothetical protein [Syntrophomonas palmitatica]|uniref:hypothetical protein n=1 Tax=Syntrophomonas palmitatica TaxID=402877 RepID=UPI0006D125FB|nr:hypothetical protein [Syntrophomonas palmitatica]